MPDLSGKSVLVAGASGGLGEPISRALADAGARLTLTARDQRKLEEIGIDGAAVVTADLGKPGEPDRVVQAAVDAHGGLDGLVYAAGVVAFGPFTELDDDVVDELLLTNYLAPLRLYRAAAKHVPRGGFLATISAVVAEKPTAGMSAYSASKAAMWAFDHAVAHELRRQGVHVLDARPPHTETGLAERPIAGEAPKLPQGKDPDAVAARIVQAIVDGERDLPSSAF